MKFIFFIALGIFLGFVRAEEERKCGQYGFHCVDSQTFEICGIPNEDGNGSTDTRQCPLETRCNEDDPTYCSPTEGDHNCNRKLRSSKKHRKDVEVLDVNNDGGHYSVDEEFKLDLLGGLEDDEPELGIPTEETTKKGDETFTEEPVIQCDMYGFYPDNENKSLFYFCDLKCDGMGFILRHMQCNINRVFDPIHKFCVIPGTIRDIRNDPLEHMVIGVDEAAEKSGFSCTEKKPGKYPDPLNCHQYHLCLPIELYEPFHQLTVQCPKRKAFDPDSKLCSRAAIWRCYGKGRKNRKNKIDCSQEMRFREKRSCDHFYICYGDQVMRIECPENHKFIEKYQQCLPAQECD